MYASKFPLPKTETLDNQIQVAYLMADISNVDAAKIKDLYERLESLSCMIPNRFFFFPFFLHSMLTFNRIARIMTRILYWIRTYDERCAAYLEWSAGR